MRTQVVVNVRRALLATVALFVLLGLAYPLAETGIGQAFFPHQANGSLTSGGSTLIGQPWTGPRWFHGRPDPDNPLATGGSNLGPRSAALVADARKQVAGLEEAGIHPTPDLVTTSGSGVDPDISPADAYAQVRAVAHARGLPPATVRHVVAAHVHQAQFGFLGAPYVDVLELNQALARLP